ncbi:MAG: uroporphyrinogen-III synthase [Bacteroides sp.]|nr:uroporphyrinogen-III synthase [Bacteroides sp.]MCM1379053.1 uroporphyrinogen-III synthase [Bacteroides sp.]MCM1445751.1 uroporphyrinogen-III synthase [Prevotella sp.]
MKPIKKILISQPRPQADKSPYFDIEKKRGVELVFRPFIKVEGLTSREFRQQKISLNDFSAVIFTARTAVDHFFRLAEEQRFNVPETMKYFCSSESIALYLQKYIPFRKRKIFNSPTGKFEDLIPILQKHHKEKYLFAVSDVNKDVLANLEKSKLQYTRAVMYRTVPNNFGTDEPFDYDMLVFFSPEGIKALQSNFPNFEQGDIRIATFGLTTAKAVVDAGLRLDLDGSKSANKSIAATIDSFILETNGEPDQEAETAKKD